MYMSLYSFFGYDYISVRFTLFMQPFCRRNDMISAANFEIELEILLKDKKVKRNRCIGLNVRIVTVPIFLCVSVI